jgi:type II secretory pathway predicted ATPase ExeA
VTSSSPTTRSCACTASSGGIPRALNNAAVAAPIAAASDGKEIVDDAWANKAVAELTRE